MLPVAEEAPTEPVGSSVGLTPDLAPAAEAEAEESTAEYPPEDKSLDTSEKNGGSGAEQSTLNYEDEAQKDFCSSVPHGWMHFAKSASKLDHGDLYQASDDDFLAHGMADVRRVLLACETSELTWSAEESL